MNNSTALSFAISEDSPHAYSLNTEQRQRLATLLDRYLSGLEAGTPISQEGLIAEHPDLAEALEIHFRSLEGLHSLLASCEIAPVIGSYSPRSTDAAGAIGDFELVREVGRGGMGVVYEARQVSLNRRVAVKLLPFAAVLEPKQIARFKMEAQAAAQVQHPNIVPVFAIGVERGIHYYAMEFVDGQPLDVVIEELQNRKPQRKRTSSADRVSRNGGNHEVETVNARGSATRSRRSPGGTWKTQEHFETVARLGIQAAEALHAAHENGIVHRDVKPANLLLDANRKLWITDFGLARCQRDATLTRTGDIVGTMRYMSPEQASGTPALIDHRADVYSLGITLYELVGLRPAFADARSPELLRRVDECDPPPLRDICPTIPADLETVILKAMAKSKDDRYATALEFADDLRRFAEGKPTLARPPTLIDRAYKLIKRNRRFVRSAVAAVLIAFFGLSVALFFLAKEKRVAEVNFVRAERNSIHAKRYFHDAREVIDFFGVELADRLAEIAGAESVRKALLDKSLEYYQGFAEEAQGEIALRADLALAYGKIAGLMAEVGSTDKALAAHGKAVDLFQELATSEPSVENKRRLALSKNNLALMLRRSGQLSRANVLFDEAIQLQRSLTAQAPQNEELQTELAASLSNLGLLQGQLLRRDEAQDSLLSSINVLEQSHAQRRTDVDYLCRLAVAYNNLGSVVAHSDVRRAIDLHLQAFTLLQAALHQHPGTPSTERDIGMTLNKLGSAFSRTREFDRAIKWYEEAISIQTKLILRAPSHGQYQKDLSLTYNNLGLALGRASSADEAEVAFRQSLALQDQLLPQAENDTGLRSNLAGVHNNLGIVLEKSGSLERAAEEFKSAIEHQRAVDATVEGRAENLDKYLVNLGRVLKQVGRFDDAAKAALERRRIWSNDGDRLFSVAETLTSICYEAKSVPGIEALSDECATMAIQTLSEARNVGCRVPNDLGSRVPFTALADSGRFQELLKSNR